MPRIHGRAAAVLLVLCTAVLGATAAIAPAAAEVEAVIRITDVSPRWGSTSGGDVVTITGSGFSGVTGAYGNIGSSGFDFSDVRVISDTEVRIVTPPGMTGLAYLALVRGSVHARADGMPFWFRPVLAESPERVLPPTTVRPGAPVCRRWEDWPGVDTTQSQVAVLNVTTVSPRSPGFALVFPDYGIGVPNASTVNFLPGADVANVTVVPLYPDIPICVAAPATPGVVIVDLLTAAARDDGRIDSGFPFRRIDTRPGSGIGDVQGALPAHVRVPGTIAGNSAQSRALLANVTVSNAPAPGNLRVFPHGRPLPGTSVANYLPGADRATAAVIVVDENQRADLFSSSPAARGTDVIVDVYGELLLHESGFVPAAERVVDTRTGLGAPRAPLPGVRDGSFLRLPVDSLGAPRTAYGAILSVIASNPTGPGHLRVHAEQTPGGSPPPLTSNLNYIPGVDSSNLVWVDLWEGGDVAFSSWQGVGSRTDLVVDVVGYLSTAGG
ncbi:IPT/TIG domain-containing protein [Cellulomonas cellasea]|uniref:IPT/TIG domain-containing protein n=1 Tax=Cellulomonas cellasea TaxID=43670 RepID=A0A7W4UFY2_9CELL|nr:IPT/TIG domain-containing protein [Cellulomonas cellasea]MBB2923417.1 hypothetical protein [Cellulomonas cellasea]